MTYEDFDRALKVRCPQCEMSAGEGCRDGGSPRSPHFARVEAFLEDREVVEFKTMPCCRRIGYGWCWLPDGHPGDCHAMNSSEMPPSADHSPAAATRKWRGKR